LTCVAVERNAASHANIPDRVGKEGSSRKHARQLDLLSRRGPTVILVRLSKGGFSGLCRYLSLVVSPVRAAAIVPILIVQDWASVWAFRPDLEPRNLGIMLPASFIDIGAGWLLYARVSEALVQLAVG
jgi:hypothetical protein